MLPKRMPNLRVGRSLPQRKIHLNSSFNTQVVLPGFTSLHSQKFHPYLVGLNIDALIRDFSHSLTEAYSAWRKVLGSLYPKRALVTMFLISLALLNVSGSQEFKKIVFPNTLVADSQNITQMTATITIDNLPNFQWPVMPGVISTNYSRWHPGLDLPRPKGTQIKPIAEGSVTAVENGWFGYGKSVVITHSSGYASRYAHLSKIEVKAGQKVTIETEIGQIGSTGHSTGNHLHFEVYSEGKTLNPKNVLPSPASVLASGK